MLLEFGKTLRTVALSSHPASAWEHHERDSLRKLV